MHFLAQPAPPYHTFCVYPLWQVFTLGMWQGSKCLAVLVFVLWKPEWGLYSFVAGSLISSVFYIAVYYAYYFHLALARKPGKKKNEEDGEGCPFHTLADFFPRRVQGKVCV
jgi:hypothetical protein